MMNFEDKKALKIEPECFAYYFMLHHFKKTKKIYFVESQFDLFLKDFANYVHSNTEYLIVDENLKKITNKDNNFEFVEKIFDNYVEQCKPYSVLYETSPQKYFCFDAKLIKLLRNSYQKNEAFKKLAVEYEKKDIEEVFTNDIVLNYFEDNYKELSKFTEKIKKEDKTFDA